MTQFQPVFNTVFIGNGGLSTYMGTMNLFWNFLCWCNDYVIFKNSFACDEMIVFFMYLDSWTRYRQTVSRFGTPQNVANLAIFIKDRHICRQVKFRIFADLTIWARLWQTVARYSSTALPKISSKSPKYRFIFSLN